MPHLINEGSRPFSIRYFGRTVRFPVGEPVLVTPDKVGSEFLKRGRQAGLREHVPGRETEDAAIARAVADAEARVRAEFSERTAAMEAALEGSQSAVAMLRDELRRRPEAVDAPAASPPDEPPAEQMPIKGRRPSAKRG